MSSEEAQDLAHSHGCCSGMLRFSFYLLVFIIPIYLLCRYTHIRGKIGHKVMHILFTKYIPDHPTLINTTFGKQKEELFGRLAHDVGPSGQLNVVEIGAGTGANFKFLPRGTRVTCLEPNANHEATLKKNAEATDGAVVLERVVLDKAEDMKSFKDESVDAVISTFVMCCVDNVDATLKEVKRILKPGGKLYCMENATTASIYDWLRWYILNHGFEKNVKWETYMNIHKAGFTDVSLKFYEAEQIRDRVPFFVKPLVGTRVYCGTATK